MMKTRKKLTTLLVLCVMAAACNLPSATATATTIPTKSLTPTPLAVSWTYLGMPDGAQKIYQLVIHPQDQNLWFVIGYPGSSIQECAVFRTADGGQSWQTVYTGGTIRDVRVDPSNPDILYSTDDGKLIRSNDRGGTWGVVNDFDDMIESLHVSGIDKSIYVLPRWYNDNAPGVYRSVDNGESWQRFSFGGTLPNFIPWDIEEDPNTGILYVVIEIGDHPDPYDPPFYRSLDRGVTWEEVGDDLPWHGLSIQVDPQTSDVYYLAEGAGLYLSHDQGLHWTRISPELHIASELTLDPASPPRLFGGDYVHGAVYTGGVYYSDNGGESFTFLGLEGQVIADITLNAESTRLYVVSYEQGIYTAVISAPE